MSLILEALRKSEAQRRLGQAPDLHSPVAAAPRRGRLPRWLVPALALMLVGALAWWLGRMAVPDPSNGTATEAVVEPLPLPLDAPAAEAIATPAGAPVEPVAPTRAPEAAPAPARTAPPAPSPVAPTPAPAAPSPAAPAPAVPSPAPPTAQAEASPAPPPATGAVPSAVAAPEVDPGLLRLADLPPATRAGLPALRISMHVYAEDPVRRFAIIDGRRVGEGGLLEGQGVVEAIRRDGIVVDFDGRRVLLPRP